MIGESAKDPRLDNLQCISPEVWGKAATAQKAAFLFLHQWPVCNLDSLKIKYETCVLFGQIAIEESLRVGPLNTKYGTTLTKCTSLFYCGSLFQCQVSVFDIYHQKSLLFFVFTTSLCPHLDIYETYNSWQITFISFFPWQTLPHPVDKLADDESQTMVDKIRNN